MSRSISPLLLSSDDEVDAFAVDDEGEALLRMRPAASAYIDKLADEEGLVFRSLGAGCSLDAEDASPTDYSTGVQGQQTQIQDLAAMNNKLMTVVVQQQQTNDVHVKNTAKQIETNQELVTELKSQGARNANLQDELVGSTDLTRTRTAHAHVHVHSRVHAHTFMFHVHVVFAAQGD